MAVCGYAVNIGRQNIGAIVQESEYACVKCWTLTHLWSQSDAMKIVRMKISCRYPRFDADNEAWRTRWSISAMIRCGIETHLQLLVLHHRDHQPLTRLEGGGLWCLGFEQLSWAGLNAESTYDSLVHTCLVRKKLSRKQNKLVVFHAASFPVKTCWMVLHSVSLTHSCLIKENIVLPAKIAQWLLQEDTRSMMHYEAPLLAAPNILF